MLGRYSSLQETHDNTLSEQEKQQLWYTVGSTPLTLHDLCKLLPGVWLNDEIINAAAFVLQQLSNQVHICSTFFMQLLYLDKPSLVNHAAVQRWTLPSALSRTQQPHPLDCQYVIAPCHLPGHWVLAVADVLDRTIVYIDPMQASF